MNGKQEEAIVADMEDEGQEDIAEEADTNRHEITKEEVTKEEATIKALSLLTTVLSSLRDRPLNE